MTTSTRPPAAGTEPNRTRLEADGLPPEAPPANTPSTALVISEPGKCLRADGSFNFDALPPDVGQEIRLITERICDALEEVKSRYVDVGKLLLSAKEQLDYGAFMDWVGAEFEPRFGLGIRTAQNMMLVAAHFADQPEYLEHFSDTALIVLAKAPEPVREEVLGEVNSGARYSVSALRQRLRQQNAPAVSGHVGENGNAPTSDIGVRRDELVIALRSAAQAVGHQRTKDFADACSRVLTEVGDVCRRSASRARRGGDAGISKAEAKRLGHMASLCMDRMTLATGLTLREIDQGRRDGIGAALLEVAQVVSELAKIGQMAKDGGNTPEPSELQTMQDRLSPFLLPVSAKAA